MKLKLILIVLCLSFLSCGDDIGGESDTVDVEAFPSLITKGSEEGINVPDPLAPEESSWTLTKDFFNFSVTVTNNNSKALIITHIEAKVSDLNSNTEKTFSYPSQQFEHCTDFVPDLVLGGRYFTFLLPGESASLGSFSNSLFYVDQLEEDEVFGGYKVEAFVEVFGFFTSATATDPMPGSCTFTPYESPIDDPFLKNEGPFKRVVFFQVFN